MSPACLEYNRTYSFFLKQRKINNLVFSVHIHTFFSSIYRQGLKNEVQLVLLFFSFKKIFLPVLCGSIKF